MLEDARDAKQGCGCRATSEACERFVKSSGKIRPLPRGHDTGEAPAIARDAERRSNY